MNWERKSRAFQHSQHGVFHRAIPFQIYPLQKEIVYNKKSKNVSVMDHHFENF